jgi:hypothetical protein
MSDVTPAGQVNSAVTTDPGSEADATKAQQAFADGIAQFMASLLQGAQSDIISAINDTSSDPDAPN